MGNVIGEPFESYVHDQINARQRIQGKSIDRSLEEISYLNSRNAWIKLASGVQIDKRRYDLLQKANPLGNDLINSLTSPSSPKETPFVQNDEVVIKTEYFYSKEIAQKYVLFNGLGDGNRAGITGDNKAYGVGGQDQGFSPMPGILDADIKDLNRGSIKKATVNIKAHNKNQFDIIDVLYLRLGFTVMLEWGTDKYWDDRENKLITSRTSLIDKVFFNDTYDNSDYTKILPKIIEERENTRGNYDALLGTISNFSWSFNKDGSYDISLEIISLGDVIESLKINLPTTNISIIDPNTLASIQNIQSTFSSNAASNLSSFFSLYTEFDLEGKIENYFNSVKSDEKEYIKYTPFSRTDYEDYLFRYVFITGQDRNIAEDDFNIEGANLNLTESPEGAVTLLSNTLEYFNFTTPTLPEGSDGQDLLTQQLDNLNTFLPRAILFSLSLNANGKILPSSFAPPNRFFSSNSVTINKNQLEEIKPEFSYNKFKESGGWSTNGGSNNNGSPISFVGIGNQFDADTTPEAFYKLDGNDGLRNEENNLIKYNSVDLTFYTTGFDITPDEVPSYFILNAVGAEASPRNDSSKLIKNQRILFNNIDLEKFKIGIFQYFKLINAAGGQEDETFSVPEYETTADFLLGEQDKNVIYRYLNNVIDFSENKGGYNSSTTEIKVFNEFIGKIVNPTNGNKLSEWNSQKLFPFYFEDSDTRDFFKIPNSGGDNQYYIKLGVFLDFLQEQVILKVDSKESPPLIKIDTDYNTNICYVIDNVISTDSRKCIIRNNSFTVDGAPENKIKQQLFKGLDFYVNTTGKYSWGRIMQIYFSFTRIVDIIKDVDENGTITLFKLLKTICTDINESLGYINNLEPVIDKETNTIKIIDQTPIPGIEEIGKFLNIPNFSNKESILEIFGYNQTSKNPSQYTSTFVNNVGITTEINKDYASIITIGATANGAVPGVESTAFSKWNVGIKDRFKDQVKSATSTDKESLEKQNSIVISNYKNLIKYESNPTKMFRIVGFTNSLTPVDFNPEQIELNKNTIPNFYKYAQAKTSLDSINLESSVGFLPFNLSLEMDGLSGIKIYNKINVNSSFLPSNYPQTLKFVVTGVNHRLVNNDWRTSLNTIATSISKDQSGIINTFKLLQLTTSPSEERALETYIPSDAPKSKIKDNESQYGTRGQEISLQTLVDRLNPEFRDRFKSFIGEFIDTYNGYTLLINATFRTFKKSAQLKKDNSSNASPGKSAHNYGLAIDFNLITPSGKTLKKQENKNEWIATGIVDISKKYGLGWGGNFSSYKDYIHFYVNGWNSTNSTKILDQVYTIYRLGKNPSLTQIEEAGINPYSSPILKIVKDVLS